MGLNLHTSYPELPVDMKYKESTHELLDELKKMLESNCPAGEVELVQVQGRVHI